MPVAWQLAVRAGRRRGMVVGKLLAARRRMHALPRGAGFTERPATAVEPSLSKAERHLDRIEKRPPPDMRRPADALRLADRFLRVAPTSLGMESAALVMVIEGTYLGPLITRSKGLRSPRQLHFMFGEGPVIDAWRTGTVVEVPDFEEATMRWPAVAPAALAQGIRSIVCIPFPHHEMRCLVLILRGRTPIPRPHDFARRIHRLTRLAEKALLDNPAVVNIDSLQCHIDEAVRRHHVVYQASGVLASKHDIDPSEALDVLRFRAWSTQRDLCSVAREHLENDEDP